MNHRRALDAISSAESQSAATNSNHLYRSLAAVIERARARLVAEVRDVDGFPAAVLVDGLVQRLLEISLRAYALRARARVSLSVGTLDDGLHLETGRISLAARQRLVCHRDFVLHWAYCVAAIVAPKRSEAGEIPAVLIFGLDEQNIIIEGSDEEFLAFCRKGPVRPLIEGRRFFVQAMTPTVSSAKSQFIYCRRPLVELLREGHLGLLGRLRLLSNQVRLLGTYFDAVARTPELCLLARDFAYSEIAVELDRRGLIDALVLTCGMYVNQPLWARILAHSETHMIWYAQNWKPIYYLADNVDSDVPNLPWIRADVHWVWTETFAKYLRDLGLNGRMEVVGPIVWRLAERRPRSVDRIEIAIFDVSPYGDDVALDHGQTSNFNTAQNVEAFLHDIIALKPDIEHALGQPVSFSLKTARGFHVTYDHCYFALLSELNAAGTINLKPHTTNLYGMVAESHLIIAYPFTSPVYIAEALNVPAVFYDPTGTVAPSKFSDKPSAVSFAGNREALRDKVMSALRTSTGGHRYAQASAENHH